MTRLASTQANPKVIAWARKNSGRDAAGVAKRLGLAVEAYGEVEAGARHLTLAQLRMLANVVKRPLATFYLPTTPPDVTKPTDYRSSSGSIGRDLMLSFRKAQRVQDFSKVTFDETSPLFRIHATLNTKPSVLAAQAREALGLTRERQERFRGSKQFTGWLVENLASAGVHVLFHGYSVDDAKAYTLPGIPPVVVVNRRDFLNSQLFSLLHELAHLILRKPGMCDAIGADGESALETYCNRFASNFIIPTAWIKELIAGRPAESLTSDAALDELAQVFSTSRDVVLLKLVSLHMVNQTAYVRMRGRWNAEAIAVRNARKGGRTSVKANAINDNGNLFVSEVAQAYASSELSVIDAAELLGINPGYVDEVVGVVGGAG